MFYIMLRQTVPAAACCGHREIVQTLLGRKFRFYGTTRVMVFDKRLSTPALLIAVAANS